MKKKIVKSILVCLALAFSIFINLHDVDAENKITTQMFVSPLTQRIILMPGESYRGTVTVSNSINSMEDLYYSVSAGSYNKTKGESDKDDYGGTDVDTRTKYNIMVDWITIEEPYGVLKPNSSIEVPFTIKVPEDAPGGAQYASIIVLKDSEKEEKNGGNININEKIQFASAIIANVTGETIEKAEIESNSVPAFLLTNNLETTSMVKNLGNIYTDAKYTLQVFPIFSDEEIFTNVEKPETNLVLPDTERFHAQTTSLPSIGIFRVKQTVKIFDEVSEVEKMVIVCPTWLIFIIVFAIIIFVMWIIFRVRSHQKR